MKLKARPALALFVPLAIGVSMANLASWRVKRVGVTGQPFQVAFSPDGRRVALASQSITGAPGHVEIWNVASPWSLRGPDAHERSSFAVGQPLSLCFSGDSRTLICTAYGEIIRFDTLSRQRLPSLKNEPGLASYAQIWPRRDTLAFKSYGKIEQRNARTGQSKAGFSIVAPDRADSYSPVAFAPDGKTAAWVEEDTNRLMLRDTRSKRVQAVSVLPKASDHLQCGVTALTFSPDARILAVAWNASVFGSSGTESVSSRVTLWNLKTRQIAATWTESGESINAHAFSPDGALLAAARSDSAISVREARTGKLSRNLQSPGQNVQSVAFSPDGRTLASCGSDGALNLWRIR